MARDEILLEQADHYGAATIRWYRWNPATLSLGYFQDDDAGISPNLPRVRRLSGGGAILHDDEWTYSITAPRGTFADARQLYADVHSILVRHITQLGCNVDMRGVDRPEIDGNFLCFNRGDRHDVIATDGPQAGTKVIGSAQRRRGKAILQHGSIHLSDIRQSDSTSATPPESLDKLITFEDFCTRVSSELISRSGCRQAEIGWAENELEDAAIWAHRKYEKLIWDSERRRGPATPPRPPTGCS